MPGNFGPSAAVVQAISSSWRWSSPGAHHILGRCDWCQFVELLLQHIQDFRPRRNRSVAGKIWSNRGAVSTLSRSGRNICRPVEVYFHDRAPRSEDTAKAAARQREKIWGLITSPRRFRIAPRCKKSCGPDSVSTRWARQVDLARFNSSAAAIFSEAARGGQNLWPKPRPDIVRKTGTRQRRSSGPEKVELARAYAQTNSEARYITAGSVSTVRRQKKGKAPNPTRSWSKNCDPPLQHNTFSGAGRWHIPTISPGPPLQMDRNCQAT